MTREQVISNKIKYCGLEVGKIYSGQRIVSIEPGADEHSPLLIRYEPESARGNHIDAIKHCSDYYFREHFVKKEKIA